MDVSVIVTTHNVLKFIDTCLDSLRSQTYRDFEIIVVDNNSTDGTPERIATHYPDVQLHRLNCDLGFQGANNLGVKLANGEYIVLLNSDTKVEPDWLEHLIQPLREQQEVMETYSLILNEGDDYDKSTVTRCKYSLCQTINLLHRNILLNVSEHEVDIPFYGMGCAIAFRKSEIGEPFDETYKISCDDTYLSWYVRILGKKVRLVPESVVHHAHPPLQEGRRATLRSFYYWERNRLINMFIFFEKRTLAALLPLLPLDYFILIVSSYLRRKHKGGVGGSRRACTEKYIAGKHAISSMLNAFLWLLKHRDWLWHKRTKIQLARKVTDNAITRYMSSKFVDGRTDAGKMLNKLAKIYFWLWRIPTLEDTQKSKFINYENIS
jgi:hypothetical protein